MCAVTLAILAGPVYALEKPAAAKPQPTTLENLQKAFEGESNAKARYEAFAAKADMEGYLGVAGLFRAAAFAESLHAAKHAKAIEALGAVPTAAVKAPAVKSTKENLKFAIKGENQEARTMYPGFIKKAESNKNQQAAMSFKGAMATEKSHAKLFSKAAADLNGWKAKKKFIVCQTCGYTTDDLTIKVCPVCAQPREQFKEIQ
ncbi:MAG TPA: rubrerythrin [Elusimicrobia bacterium]|nr:rubrerythrin [Elusimicrobiota bacterium]HCE97072.1 rubrerythrin [Elusimicrobiota bacterium]